MKILNTHSLFCSRTLQKHRRRHVREAVVDQQLTLSEVESDFMT
jgi:hypothetical protein